MGVVNFLMPLSSFGSTMSFLALYGDYAPSSYKMYLYYTLLADTVCCVYAGIINIMNANNIRKRKQEFLHFWQISVVRLVIVTCILRVINIIMASMNLLNVAYLVGQMIGYICITALGLAIFSYYIKSSVRVRTYMGSDTYLRMSVFNKNSISPPPADGYNYL